MLDHHAARVDETSFFPIDTGIYRYVADGSILAAESGLTTFQFLIRFEPAENILNNGCINVVLGDVVANILRGSVAEERHLGTVRPQDCPVLSHPVESNGSILNEIRELFFSLFESA